MYIWTTYPLISNSMPCGDPMFPIFSLHLPYSITVEASPILMNCPCKGAEMKHVSLVAFYTKLVCSGTLRPGWKRNAYPQQGRSIFGILREHARVSIVTEAHISASRISWILSAIFKHQQLKAFYLIWTRIFSIPKSSKKKGKHTVSVFSVVIFFASRGTVWNAIIFCDSVDGSHWRLRFVEKIKSWTIGRKRLSH